ncbi:MAG: NAD kinase [Muribaculaceae bacterium]|nr:NAD kinase [Muribaculaceae bacterium]
MKTILIFGNAFIDNKEAQVIEMIAQLQERGFEVLIEKKFLKLLKVNNAKLAVKPFDSQNTPNDAYAAISVGGDGTFLRTTHNIGNSNIPIMGINAGHLGYLTAGSLADHQKLITALCKGDYRTEERAVLEVSTDSGIAIKYPYGLNEIAILKRDTSSMIEMETVVNGKPLTTYSGDGLVVCTPTGSTAYNLSAGGPIVEPTTPCVVLSPVSPHSLTMRPLVLRDDSKISIKVITRTPVFQVSVDGAEVSCPSGTTVTIKRAAHNVKVVQLPNHYFAKTLRKKLMWGADQR